MDNATKTADWFNVDFPERSDIQVMIDKNGNPDGPLELLFKHRPWIFTGQVETDFIPGLPSAPPPPPRRPSFIAGYLKGVALAIVLALIYLATLDR